MLGFFKKSTESKSYNSALARNTNPQTSASVFIGGDGSLLKTIYYSGIDEISRNLSVNTIINKQNSIVNEATLVVKEKDDPANKSTNKKEFLDFLSWIENPNFRPFPRSRSEIFNYILSNSYKKGIFGIVYVFDKQNNFKYIRIPASIELENYIINQVKYRLCFDHRTISFEYSQKYRNYAIKTTNEIMILQVGGNFDNDLQNYAPKFKEVLPYIILQNQLIDFATSFHQNSCFPSQVVTLTYDRPKDEVGDLDPVQKRDFDAAVKSVIEQIQQSIGSKNSGGIIIPTNPNIKIDIKPLSIPTNATDNIRYQDSVSRQIYSAINAGSVNAIEGRSQYSNNSKAELKELYDAAFRSFNSLVITPMNQFMQGLIGSMYPDINASNYYLSFDKSQVDIYQKEYIAQDVMLVQNNILTLNESRQILAKTSNRYSFIGSAPEGDVFNSELSGNATKPRVEIKGISTKPTDEMAKNARQGLEWRAEFNRGGTEVGVARARDISNQVNLSLNTIKRMVSFFARHEVDKKAEGFHYGEKGFPSAGRIAWMLWGGDAGRSWALDKLRQLEPDE